MIWKDSDKISGKPIGKALMSLAVPAVMSTFFTVIFEIIDMFWIGKLGAISIAALSGASFFVWMLRGLGLAVATGAIALVARRTGEKDEQGLLQTIGHAVVATCIFAAAMMVVFLPIALQMFQWLKLDPGVAVQAEDFTIIFISGLIFVYLMMSIEFIIRGLGDTRTPMIITGLSLLLNVFLDPLFIFAFDMGLKGAAVATITAQAVGTLLMAMVLFKKIPVLKRWPAFRGKNGKLGEEGFFRRFRTIVTIGVPTAMTDAGFSLIYLFLSGIVSYFGKEPLAALGIAHRLEAPNFFICLGYSMAVAPMVGQYLGAGNPENARKSVYLSLKITTGISIVIAIVYYIYAPELFGLFTNDPGIIRHGAQYLRIIIISDIFLPLEVVLAGAFSGAGDTKPPFFISFPITTLRIPLSYLLAVTLGWGTVAIWIVIGSTTLLKGLLQLYVFSRGNWAKKRI